MKNGAELLDRLIKDIVSESASSYVSVLQNADHTPDEDESLGAQSEDLPTAFSLGKFIPLLEERIHVINPFTRTFLVSWITLLDSIPDLELVFYLPTFLGGLFKFLSDLNQDVHTATQTALERFLSEIRKIARIKRGIAESRRSREEDGLKRYDSTSLSGRSASVNSFRQGDDGAVKDRRPEHEGEDHADSDAGSNASDEEKSIGPEEDWIPGQDVQVDHAKILDILVTFLSDSSGKFILRFLVDSPYLTAQQKKKSR